VQLTSGVHALIHSTLVDLGTSLRVDRRRPWSVRPGSEESNPPLSNHDLRSGKITRFLAFRQEDVRRWWAAMRRQTLGAALRPLTNDDPARYVLRIAGVMICAFGIVIALLFTLAHFTLRSSG
jgi:hypothetical protein